MIGAGARGRRRSLTSRASRHCSRWSQVHVPTPRPSPPRRTVRACSAHANRPSGPRCTSRHDPLGLSRLHSRPSGAGARSLCVRSRRCPWFVNGLRPRCCRRRRPRSRHRPRGRHCLHNCPRGRPRRRRHRPRRRRRRPRRRHRTHHRRRPRIRRSAPPPPPLPSQLPSLRWRRPAQGSFALASLEAHLARPPSPRSARCHRRRPPS